MENLKKQEYGLNLKTVECIRNVFERYEQISQVIIYGSRAKGNFQRGSDIDLSIYDKITDQSVLEHIKRVGKNFFLRDNSVN